VPRRPIGGTWGPGFAYSAPSPARVLATCQAQRCIVVDYREALERVREDSQNGSEDREFYEGRADALGTAMVNLAVAYASHRDYREQWRPS
jgi:hypothetical protein